MPERRTSISGRLLIRHGRSSILIPPSRPTPRRKTRTRWSRCGRCRGACGSWATARSGRPARWTWPPSARPCSSSTPDVVFNLVESLDGADSLQYLPAGLLDALGMPYTGNPTEAIFQTTHKLLAKQILQPGRPADAGLAGWRTSVLGTGSGGRTLALAALLAGPPPASSRPSGSMPPADWTTHNVIRRGRRRAWCASGWQEFAAGQRPALLRRAVRRGPGIQPVAPRRAATGRKSCRRPRSTSPPSRRTSRGSWAIGPNGKQARSSSTTRRGASISPPAIGRCWTGCGDLALACWRLFGLRGYARVDFRVDRAGPAVDPGDQHQPLPFARRRLRRRAGPGGHPLSAGHPADFRRRSRSASRVNQSAIGSVYRCVLRPRPCSWRIPMTTAITYRDEADAGRRRAHPPVGRIDRRVQSRRRGLRRRTARGAAGPAARPAAITSSSPSRTARWWAMPVTARSP